jgi:hypothetical protein
MSSESDLKQVDPVITTTSQTSSDIVESPTSDSPEKRRSWLYKSLIKPNKKGSNNNNKTKPIAIRSQDSNQSTPNAKSPAASIVDEFYQNNPRTLFQDNATKSREKKNHHNKHSRSHTLHPSLSANLVAGSSSNPHHSRRHSFDDYPSLIKENSSYSSSIQDEALNQWDQELEVMKV